jgi:putative ergosteryl-3beta-O-L-aspartate hydrolase
MDLFNTLCLYPPYDVSLSDPYISPAIALDVILRGLPKDIIYTCEWDELRAKAERLKERLMQDLGKTIRYRMFEGVAHTWDKSPKPFKRDSVREET